MTVPGRVLVVGAGLVGTSVGLGLRPGGTDVLLADASPTVAAVAADLGAGRLPAGGVHLGSGSGTDDGTDLDGPPGPVREGDEPDLVVVAAPPDVTAGLVVRALRRYPRAVVTDVASTKEGVVRRVLAAAGEDAARYVGGHPMAGRERSGPMAARGDLFVGRPWVLTPVPGTSPEAVDLVRTTAGRLGAVVVELDPASHDEAVALVSHLPQVAASLVAARLVGAPGQAVGLAGQGLRDVTRIAASDPVLWAQILAGNAVPLARQLRLLREDLDRALAALEAVAAAGAPGLPGASDPAASGGPAGSPTGAPVGALARLVAEGNAGRATVPGKHGDAPAVWATVPVLVPDRPGALASLIGTIGEVGVNIEDLRIEHSPGRLTGVTEVAVLPAERDRLVRELRERGWSVPD
ncbi:prephenate dehydrogenase [Aquipuribacter hungaricus]|uniref:Prephenate dehydrogenase n=3 Tax=Aquipuribacter hungaricus TaxID=545624 RepID=A0ABV7WEY0_9MICO